MKKSEHSAVILPSAGQRGPAEHDRRAQIVEAADNYMRHYGYGKTTVADVAKTIGLSTAYIYKFFESKQAIGEAICARCLNVISEDLRRIAHESKPAPDRLRRMYKSVAQESVRRFFHERRLHDIVNIAREAQWQIIRDYQSTVLELILHVVAQGRADGAFENATSLMKTCKAVAQTFLLVSHPVLLEENLDALDEITSDVSALVLRGLMDKNNE